MMVTQLRVLLEDVTSKYLSAEWSFNHPLEAAVAAMMIRDSRSELTNKSMAGYNRLVLSDREILPEESCTGINLNYSNFRKGGVDLYTSVSNLRKYTFLALTAADVGDYVGDTWNPSGVGNLRDNVSRFAETLDQIMGGVSHLDVLDFADLAAGQVEDWSNFGGNLFGTLIDGTVRHYASCIYYAFKVREQNNNAPKFDTSQSTIHWRPLLLGEDYKNIVRHHINHRLELGPEATIGIRMNPMSGI